MRLNPELAKRVAGHRGLLNLANPRYNTAPQFGL